MKRSPKFGPRYGYKKFGEGGETSKKPPPPKKPTPPPPISSSDDLVPRGNLPDKSVVPRSKRYGEDVKPRLARGGSVKSSASRRADGIAQRGKTRGRFV
jgi:hypothetical protein